MKRVKVINNPIDLIPILHAMGSEVKKKVFQDVSNEWHTKSSIKENYGGEGVEALEYFAKIKLVQTKWEPTSSGVEMAYKSYYTTFHIDAGCPIEEAGEILFVIQLNNKEFKKIEKKILDIVETGETFPPTIGKQLAMSETMLKGVVKRSTSLLFKGMKITKSQKAK